MMLTPPRQRGRDAKRPKLEPLEGRDLLASLVLHSPTGSPPIQVAASPAPAPAPAPASIAAMPTALPEVALAQFEPLTGRILVRFTADPSGYDPAILTNPANYSFSLIQGFEGQPTKSQSRPKAGIVLPPPYQITGVTLANPIEPGVAPTVIVSINNNEPLRFGVYGFAIRSVGLVDHAGRQLDGQYSGTFPSGNGQGGGNFLAVLSEVNSTVLPALTTSADGAPVGPSGSPPGYVFLPSTRAFRVVYSSATPGKFMLAGGNNLTLRARSFQYFPGTYRLPALNPAAIPGFHPRSKKG